MLSPRSREHSGSSSGESINVRGAGRVLWNAVFLIHHGYHDHEHTAVMATLQESCVHKHTQTYMCTYTRCECRRESSWEKERVQREWDREGKSKYKINKYKIILKNWRKGDSQKGLVASKSTSIHPLWEILIYFHLCFVVDRTEIQYNCDCESWLTFLCPCLDVSPSLLWWIYGYELCNAMPKTSHSIWFWYRKL